MSILTSVRNNTHALFLQWLLFVVTAAFGAAAIQHFEYFELILANDPTHLCQGILSILFAGTLFAGWRIWQTSREQASLLKFRDRLNNPERPWDLSYIMRNTFIGRHVQNLVGRKITSQQTLLECEANRRFNKNELLFFLAETCQTLGLIGTLVGVAMALWPFFTLEEFTFESVRDLLGIISGGVAVALFTTLVGTAASLLLKFQNYLLETGTNALVSDTAYLCETKIVPFIETAEK